jgi:hypothetical protein
MDETAYDLRNSFEKFIERQVEFYRQYGIDEAHATVQARRDLEQHIDSLPVAISKKLNEIYKQI